MSGLQYKNWVVYYILKFIDECKIRVFFFYCRLLQGRIWKLHTMVHYDDHKYGTDESKRLGK